MLIEKADRSKGAICFHNKDVFHIRCITEGDALLCKTVIDFILHLIDHNDRICGYPALDLKKKRGFDLFSGETTDQFRFLKEAFLRGHSFQRGMRTLVIASDKGQKAPSEFFQCMKIFATKSSDELKKGNNIEKSIFVYCLPILFNCF